MTGQDIVDEARTWLGVPWRHLGRNRAGIDCVGLGVVVTRALGISDYDVASYGRTPVPGLVDHIRRVMTEIPVTDIRAGDVIALKDSAYPFHVAFVSEKYGVTHIIHAHARRRMVVEEPYTGEWPGLTTHAFRFPGIE